MRPRPDYITAAVQTNREWLALTRALDKPEWLDDPRFKHPGVAPAEHQRAPAR